MIQSVLRASRAIVLLATLASIAAQSPSWSPDFATAGLGGRTFAAETFGGELYVGGWWFAAKGGIIRGIARFDGRDWKAVSSGIDLLGNVLPFIGPQVRAMAVYGGELIFAGTFDRAGGQVITNIARWNGSVIRPLGTGLQLSFGDADVHALAVFNNELYAAGQFDRAGGVTVDGIARWDGTTWRPVGTGLRQNSGASVGQAYALCSHNGRLFAGGNFDRAGGVVVQHLAAWDGSTWSALGAGSAFPAYALAPYGTEVVAAAQFSFGTRIEMAAAWDGSVWHPLGQGGPDLPVVALCAIGTDLYAGGHFTALGPYFARFDGSNWTNVGGIHGVFSGTTSTAVYGLYPQAGEVIVLGEFTTAGRQPGAVGAVRSANVAAFDGTEWRGFGGGNGIDAPARALFPWRGRIIAAGGFTEAGAVRAIGLAAFDGDRWLPLADLDGDVADAALFQDDLIVSGTFTHIDGQPFPGIARFDGSTWTSFGSLTPPGLHTHGNDLFGFGGGAGLQRWNGSAFVTVALPGQIVSHMHSHVDGKLYLSTDNAFTHTLYCWSGSQAQQIGTANDFVHCIGSFGSDVVIGGRFTAVNGTASTLIARWNGTNWSAMPAPLSGYAVDAVTEFEGGLVVGVSGDPRGYCLRLNGGIWQGLGTGLDGVPHLFLPDPATACLWMSGVTLTAGGMPSLNLAQWRTQPAWNDLLHGTGGVAGIPLLLGRGAMQSGSTATWTVEAPPNLPVALVVGASRIDQPLFGGTLVPLPDAIATLSTGTTGVASLSLVVPPGLPAGVDLFAQAWLVDPSGPSGLTSSNALQCSTR